MGQSRSGIVIDGKSCPCYCIQRPLKDVSAFETVYDETVPPSARSTGKFLVGQSVRWPFPSSSVVKRVHQALDAFPIDPSNAAEYSVFYPFRRGRLATYASKQVVTADILVIWKDVLVKVLKLQETDWQVDWNFACFLNLIFLLKKWQNFDVLLVIPDLFSRREVRTLVNLILGQLKFRSVAPIQVRISTNMPQIKFCWHSGVCLCNLWSGRLYSVHCRHWRYQNFCQLC